MTSFAITSAWTRIALAGQAVEVQNLTIVPVTITLSTGAPSAGADGELLHERDNRRVFDAPLVKDLWACAPAGAATLEVLSLGSSAAAALSTVVTGQVRIAVTGTAVQLPPNALVNGLVVKAKATNAQQAGSYSGTVGGSGVTTLYDGTGNGFPLAPGEAASFAVGNSNDLWVNGTAGDVFTFEGN